MAIEELKRVLTLKTVPQLQNLQFANNSMQVVQDMDALIIVTEWEAYRSPNWATLKVYDERPGYF